MEQNLYQKYINYLKNNVLPEDLSEKQEREFLNEAKTFVIFGDRIYRRKDDKEIKVLKENEIDSILFMMHNHKLAGYFGEESTYTRIKERFW